MPRATGHAGEEEALGALYRVPPDQFVAERNAAARRLRSEGLREEAERIGKLRRPTRVAASVNRAVHTSPSKASGLVAAARELRQAHERALRGSGDAEHLRAAARQERAAVEDMERAALGILRGDGPEPSPDIQRRLRETLEAVSQDEAVMQ